MPPAIDNLDWGRVRGASPEDPLRVLFSACLLGRATGWEGTPYTSPLACRLAGLERVRAIAFCPEDLVLGTPRPLTIIRGGNGRDVWAGRARVLDTDQADQTEALKRGARAMCARARDERIELAVLLDISDSCGTTVIYADVEGEYRKGPGVAAAALIEAGCPVISQRDGRTLSRLMALLEPGFSPDPEALDFHEHPWYRENLGPPQGS